MNHQDRRLLVQRYGLRPSEIEQVFKMVRSGQFTMETAAKNVIKNRTAK